MPLAVVMEEPTRKDLKTCPEGYVMVARMTYGEKLQRRAFNSKMEMKLQRGSKDATSIIDMFKEEMELYDFAHCIADHNLTKMVDQHGLPCKPSAPGAHEEPLDFKKPADVKMIAGQIAEEIATYIDEINNFELDDDAKNSNGASAPSS